MGLLHSLQKRSRSYYEVQNVNMALFRGAKAVGKVLATAVDSGIAAPSALYHKNVKYIRCNLDIILHKWNDCGCLLIGE